VDARPPIERTHADARVVGERRQPGAAARVARLRERVLDERRVGLLGVGDLESRLRNNLDPERAQQGLEFAQLPRIRGGEHELLHGAKATPSARFCRATSSAMPRCASATSDRIWASEKGSPSAVPCTSTNAPAPVMTTFMSVSQRESSA